LKSIQIDEHVVLKKLESKGSRSNLRAYLRSGASEKTFGVSLANIRKISQTLLKQANSDEALVALCRKLWASGYTEAKMLAVMTCPKDLNNVVQLNQCMDEIDFYALADLYVDEMVMKTRFAAELMQEWKQSEKEFHLKCAYRILKHLTETDDSLSTTQLQEELYQIEKRLPTAPNWARLGMHEAIIAIGKKNRRLNTVALAVSLRIGPVNVEFSPHNSKILNAEKVLSDRKLRKNLPE
jgi:3-methyladenine DNA glycosylase AlkD